MIGFGQIQVTSRLTSTASSTAQLFDNGGSGTRWALTKGLISAYTPAAGAYIEFHETYADATDIGTFLVVPIATNAAPAINIDFGERGWIATATNSRLVWLIGGANASCDVMFCGYYR